MCPTYIILLPIFLGYLHTFEPWVKPVKWEGLTAKDTAELKCISLEDNDDFCNDNPCKNDGTCYNGLSDYHCDCKCGWKGKDCNTSNPITFERCN